MLQPLIDICLKGEIFGLGVFGLTFLETLLWKVWIGVFWLLGVFRFGLGVFCLTFASETLLYAGFGKSVLA
jgi:hypothetical protein